MSLTSAPRIERPWKYLRRDSVGCERRKCTRRRVNTRKSRCSGVMSQDVQLSSLSWQYALLFPCCVRPSSSPPLIIGTPTDSKRDAIRLRFCCARSLMTRGSVVGPSTPQFQLRFELSPSWLLSPLASLCFWL